MPYHYLHRKFSGKDPVNFASQLKESGIKILTLALVREDEGDIVQKIAELASPGFSFTIKGDQPTLPGRIQQLFCRGKQAGCYLAYPCVKLYLCAFNYGES